MRHQEPDRLEPHARAELQERRALMAHGLAFARSLADGMEARWPGSREPFLREIRSVLAARVWPDGTRPHAANIASIECLVTLLHARHESGIREGVSAGVWGEMASH